MSNRSLGILIFVAAFLFRLAVAWGSEMTVLHVVNRTEMTNIAVNVAERGEFANPYGDNLTGPTAHSTPVFPLLLAAFLVLFPKTAFISIFACFASALRCAMIPMLALDAGLGRPVAVASGVLSVFYLGGLQTEVLGGVDGPSVALCLVCLIWLSMRTWRSSAWQTRAPWGLIALCGFSVLLNPSVLTVIVGIGGLGLFACARELRGQYLLRCAQLALVIFGFLLPWGIRNARVLHSFILTRSNLGMELWLSNGPDRTFDLPTNHARYHPFSNAKEAARIALVGEPRYNREKLSEVLEWIGANPADFARLTLRRFVAWWFPPGDPAIAAGKAVVTLLALPGLWLLRRRNLTLFALIAVTWITFPPLYYVIQWSSRMRYPMDWQLLLCAAVALVGLSEFMQQQKANQEPAAE